MNPHTRATVTAAAPTLVLLVFAAMLLVLSQFAVSGTPEPERTHQRPATTEDSLQRQGDLLIEDLEQAYRESGR